MVTGFAPGLPDPDTGAYLVRDTDAHSWVEVWFPEVGWVTVDPTPSAAPARTELALSADAAGSSTATALGRAFSIEESAQSGPLRDVNTSRDDGSPLAGLSGFLLLIAAGACGFEYWRRRRRLLSSEGAGPQLRELERALPLLGLAPARGRTLLGIERELAATVGTDAARYPAALRANRYRRGNPRRPGSGERRALRWALARGKGLRGRLRALRTIPPGGPRR